MPGNCPSHERLNLNIGYQPQSRFLAARNNGGICNLPIKRLFPSKEETLNEGFVGATRMNEGMRDNMNPLARKFREKGAQKINASIPPVTPWSTFSLLSEDQPSHGTLGLID